MLNSDGEIENQETPAEMNARILALPLVSIFNLKVPAQCLEKQIEEYIFIQDANASLLMSE